MSVLHFAFKAAVFFGMFWLFFFFFKVKGVWLQGGVAFCSPGVAFKMYGFAAQHKNPPAR